MKKEIKNLQKLSFILTANEVRIACISYINDHNIEGQECFISGNAKLKMLPLNSLLVLGKDTEILTITDTYDVDN